MANQSKNQFHSLLRKINTNLKNKKNYMGIVGCLSIILFLIPSILELEFFYTETKSIQIELNYEIEIDSPNDFQYLLIPLGDLGASGGVEIDIHLVTPTSSILIWKRTKYEITEPFSSFSRIKDGTGTTWLNISLTEFNLSNTNQFLVQHTLKRFDCDASYRDSRANETLWLQPTKYIDSNHSTIIEKTHELIPEQTTRKNDAQLILNFVSTNIQYNESYLFHWLYNQTYSGEVNSSASDVLRIKKGVCRQFSRLFVAMCRASGIPARYVSGYKVSEDRSISGHAWAEFLDENQNWNIVEPQGTMFEKYPITYFHLVHGPLQNSSFFEESVWPHNYVLVEDTEELDVDQQSPDCVEYETIWFFSNERFSDLLINLILCQFLFCLLFFFFIVEWHRIEENKGINDI